MRPDTRLTRGPYRRASRPGVLVSQGPSRASCIRRSGGRLLQRWSRSRISGSTRSPASSAPGNGLGVLTHSGSRADRSPPPDCWQRRRRAVDGPRPRPPRPTRVRRRSAGAPGAQRHVRLRRLAAVPGDGEPDERVRLRGGAALCCAEAHASPTHSMPPSSLRTARRRCRCARPKYGLYAVRAFSPIQKWGRPSVNDRGERVDANREADSDMLTRIRPPGRPSACSPIDLAVLQKE